jgi:Flp pilus assembly pilin Flp
MVNTSDKHISRRFRRFLKADEAASAIEYAILVGTVVAGLTAALVAFSGDITEALEVIGGAIDAPTGIAAPDLDGTS